MTVEFLILGPAILLLLILFIPVKGAGSYGYTPPAKRVHEAESVLSRRLLVPGSKSYIDYYKIHPDHQKADDRSRKAPGLLSDQAGLFDRGTFSAARANFNLIASLQPYSSGPVSERPSDTDPVKVSTFLSRWLRQTGAHSVGFTLLRDHHLYSHKGRGPLSGKPIRRKHGYAIAITVEMDRRMLQSAPEGTTVMESSEQYLRSGLLALKAAAFIRELGYEAAAHIDGKYQVICPLVAVDAGLGTIGRMGLLMTPDLGPRVRISVVTTSMPLEVSGASTDGTMIHFCHHCEKCALNCPAGAIPNGPRKVMDGSVRWKIDSERCYHYWTQAGTDCGRCISVCPYSHTDNRFHHFIRWAVKNNLVFRRLAIKLDDLIYGRRPAKRPLPGWTGPLDKP